MAMPVFALALYLLLAVPVRGLIKAEINGETGGVCVTLRAGGCVLRYEKQRPGKGGAGAARGQVLAQLRAVLSAFQRFAEVEQLCADARIGTGEASGTALAAGLVQGALCAALCPFAQQAQVRAQVRPDFSSRVFFLRVQCIFSFTAGDVIIRAAVAALKKRRKEGTRWSSIPSRA